MTRVQRSCGWGVPHYEYLGDRDVLLQHNAKRTQENFFDRHVETSGTSIDGLPGIENHKGQSQ